MSTSVKSARRRSSTSAICRRASVSRLLRDELRPMPLPVELLLRFMVVVGCVRNDGPQFPLLKKSPNEPQEHVLVGDAFVLLQKKWKDTHLY